jgi:predicted RNA-binding protein with RPS1 domain
MFPHAFGFELLVDHMRAVEAFERRRANLISLFAARAEDETLADARDAMAEVRDEGDLEDMALAIEPSSNSEGGEPLEKEEHQAFVDLLHGDWKVARALRKLFREVGTIKVELTGKEGVNDAPFRGFVGDAARLVDFDAGRYLQLRHGEHLHALRFDFAYPAGSLKEVFDSVVTGFAVQEKEAYLKLFLSFVETERLPRLVQETRARLKRLAEDGALQHAWEQLQNSLQRGVHQSNVIGMLATRDKKLIAASVEPDGNLRTRQLQSKADDLGDQVLAFIGEADSVLLACQADSNTRTAAQKVQKALRAAKRESRLATVPVSVARTMMREVARGMHEAHLTPEERQCYLISSFARDPRGAAFHTPHILRSYISFRGEVNHRRLDEFEITFLRDMLQQSGVDVNEATIDVLRMVPGLDSAGVVVERSTAPFRSLEDFRLRMGLEGSVWRTAGCVLRVRQGDEPFDSRPLHPDYYAGLTAALAASEVKASVVMRTPNKVRELAWGDVLDALSWSDAVPAAIARALSKPTRRRPQHGGPKGGKKSGFSGPRNSGRALESLEVGAKLKGKVTALQAYGAFVDVGARKEGLVHVSMCSDDFCNDPSEVLTVGQEVEVRVVSVDIEKQRFRLTMRSDDATGGAKAGRGKGGKGKGKGGRGRREEAPVILAPGQKNMRPKGGRPTGRGKQDNKDKPERIKLGPDPTAVDPKAIDPNNPFFALMQKGDNK